MFFDTYRLATLQITEAVRQATLERSFRPTESASVLARTDAATPPTPMATAAPAADPSVATSTAARAADCGECRPSVAA